MWVLAPYRSLLSEMSHANVPRQIKYKTAEGSLELSPGLITVADMYPGRVRNISLFAINTFGMALSLDFISSDDRR